MEEVYHLSATWWYKGNFLQKFMTDIHLDKKGNPFKLSTEEKMELQKIIFTPWQAIILEKVLGILYECLA